MQKHVHRLSLDGTSIQDAQAQALATMEAIQKQTGSQTTTPIGDILNNQKFNQFPDTFKANTISVTDTVDIPSTIGADYDMVLTGNEPNIDNKILPAKSRQINNKNNNNNIDIEIIPSPPTNIGNVSNVSNISNMSSTGKPIQEINHMESPLHTTSTQPVMISGGIGGSGSDSANNSPRRNSISYSREYSREYSHSQHSIIGNNNAAYIGPQTPYQDISDIVATNTISMQQKLIPNRMDDDDTNITNRDGNINNKNPLVRLFRWYISPMHSTDTLHRLWYHGANAVLSLMICFIMITLFILSIIFVPFCGIGLIFVYFMCLLARHFSIIDSTFSCYFFGNNIFPRFSIGINKSHRESIIGSLKEYITDPHMLEVILYFTFVKLPAAFILSGVTMALFAYVTATLLSPLIYYLDPKYFEDGLYCLFGAYNDNEKICKGWAITSFGETFVAFLAFIPILPLTLHLSNFSAKLLCRVTLNFLSTSNNHNFTRSTSTESQQSIVNNESINNGYNGYNGLNGFNGHHSSNIMVNGAGYR